MKNALLLIVLDQRVCLVMVYFQTFLYSLRLVIITKHQLRTALVADSFFFRCRELDVVGSAAL